MDFLGRETVKENTCLSGGATGADLQWGMVAGSKGHSVFHFSFAGHRSQAPTEEIVILSPEQLEAADEPLKAASARVKRYFPPKSLFVRNLLRRNWYQVAAAERVYAVATLTDGLVSGGTAWATAMFIDRFNGAACECYVFDQAVSAWFIWNGDGWTPIAPPAPHGLWAGIGSRELQQNGKEAIRALLGYVKPS